MGVGVDLDLIKSQNYLLECSPFGFDLQNPELVIRDRAFALRGFASRELWGLI